MPSSGIRAFGIKHRGHGQSPRLRIVARRTLKVKELFRRDYGKPSKHILFGIISRVCEDTWIKSSSYAIGAFYHNAMPVGIHKFFVKQDLPDAVHELTATVSQEVVRGSFSCQVKDEVIDLIRYLEN